MSGGETREHGEISARLLAAAGGRGCPQSVPKREAPPPVFPNAEGTSVPSHGSGQGPFFSVGRLETLFGDRGKEEVEGASQPEQAQEAVAKASFPRKDAR